MAARCIEPAKAPLDAEFRAVASKSATHRALVAASMAQGRSTIVGPLVADDTLHTLRGIASLGARVQEDAGGWHVDGTAGRPAGGGRIDLGASGTSARFLVALAALGAMPSLLDGTPRLRERPLADLLDALLSLGASIRATSGALPVTAGGTPVAGGAVTVSGAQSSQFASALLLAGAGFERGLRLEVPAPRVSASYVDLTIEMLNAFSGGVRQDGEGVFVVSPRTLLPATVHVEGDHSSASYHFAAVAILGGRVRMTGLRRESLQPDARFLADLASLGCRVEHDRDGVTLTADGRLPGFSWDLSGAPDLAPTAAVLALFSSDVCRLSGLEHLRVKESDRMTAIAANLEKLGATAAVRGGTLTIEPPTRGARRGACIEVEGDHRIAMAFAVAGLAIPGVSIDDPEVVTKSYPGYWDDAQRLVRTGS